MDTTVFCANLRGILPLCVNYYVQLEDSLRERSLHELESPFVLMRRTTTQNVASHDIHVTR